MSAENEKTIVEMWSDPASLEFVTLVDEIILPVLKPYGFQHVPKPDGWIAPEVLLESSNRWFGASWDWRDRYLDASLGRLFLFRDVLPRVVVRGPLSVAKTNDGETDADFVREVLGRMAIRLPKVLERFDELYSQSITTSTNSKITRGIYSFSERK